MKESSGNGSNNKKADVYRSNFNAYVHHKNLHTSLVKQFFSISLLLLLFLLDVTADAVAAFAHYYFDAFFVYFVAFFSVIRTSSARVHRRYIAQMLPKFLYALMKSFDTEADEKITSNARQPATRYVCMNNGARWCFDEN